MRMSEEDLARLDEHARLEPELLDDLSLAGLIQLLDYRERLPPPIRPPSGADPRASAPPAADDPVARQAPADEDPSVTAQIGEMLGHLDREQRVRREEILGGDHRYKSPQAGEEQIRPPPAHAGPVLDELEADEQRGLIVQMLMTERVRRAFRERFNRDMTAEEEAAADRHINDRMREMGFARKGIRVPRPAEAEAPQRISYRDQSPLRLGGPGWTEEEIERWLRRRLDELREQSDRTEGREGVNILEDIIDPRGDPNASMWYKAPVNWILEGGAGEEVRRKARNNLQRWIVELMTGIPDFYKGERKPPQTAEWMKDRLRRLGIAEKFLDDLIDTAPYAYRQDPSDQDYSKYKIVWSEIHAPWGRFGKEHGWFKRKEKEPPPPDETARVVDMSGAPMTLRWPDEPPRPTSEHKRIPYPFVESYPFAERPPDAAVSGPRVKSRERALEEWMEHRLDELREQSDRTEGREGVNILEDIIAPEGDHTTSVWHESPWARMLTGKEGPELELKARHQLQRFIIRQMTGMPPLGVGERDRPKSYEWMVEYLRREGVPPKLIDELIDTAPYVPVEEPYVNHRKWKIKWGELHAPWAEFGKKYGWYRK